MLFETPISFSLIWGSFSVLIQKSRYPGVHIRPLPARLSATLREIIVKKTLFQIRSLVKLILKVPDLCPSFLSRQQSLNEARVSALWKKSKLILIQVIHKLKEHVYGEKQDQENTSNVNSFTYNRSRCKKKDRYKKLLSKIDLLTLSLRRCSNLTGTIHSDSQVTFQILPIERLELKFQHTTIMHLGAFVIR